VTNADLDPVVPVLEKYGDVPELRRSVITAWCRVPQADRSSPRPIPKVVPRLSA